MKPSRWSGWPPRSYRSCLSRGLLVHVPDTVPADYTLVRHEPVADLAAIPPPDPNRRVNGEAGSLGPVTPLLKSTGPVPVTEIKNA